MDLIQSKACRILFKIVSTRDPRLLAVKDWYFTKLLPTIDKWHTSEGNAGVKRAKEILMRGFSIILGASVATTPEKNHKEGILEPLSYVKTDKNGVPLLVKPLVELAERYPSRATEPSQQDVVLRSCILSLCRVTDVFLGIPTDVDLASAIKRIERSPLSQVAKNEIDKFHLFVKDFLKHNEHLPFVKAYSNSLSIGTAEAKHHLDCTMHFSSKAGPNGPRSLSAHRDILALNEATTQGGDNFVSAITHLTSLIVDQCPGEGWAQNWFMSVPIEVFLESCKEAYEPNESSSVLTNSESNVIRHDFKLGKISFIPEKSGKVRLIAIPDCFTQEALIPIHKWLMNILKNIEPDCTFDQRSSIPKIQNWQKLGRTVYSFDQTSCTDLFPIDAQLVVLTERFGKPLANQVKTVMVDRDWVVKFPQSRSVRKVRWTVGQPLGAYGSWPLMALTHHLLVQYCAWKATGRVYRKPFKDYVICGDDIVIASKNVADSYLSTVQRLGMIVNKTKSHISGGQTGIQPVSEFAKIIVWKGQPLNPVRPNRLIAAMKDWRLMVPLLVDLCWGAGWHMRKQTASQLILEMHPEKSRVLKYLLTVPTELGGVGLDSGLSMREVLKVVDAKEIHPYLAYISYYIQSKLKLEDKQLNVSCERILTEVGPASLRIHPAYIYLQEKCNEVRQRLAWLFRDNRIPNVRDIAAHLMQSGLGNPEFKRFISESSSSSPEPIWEESAETQRALQSGMIWEKVLSKPSKPLTYGVSQWTFYHPEHANLVCSGLSHPEESSNRLYRLVNDFVTVTSMIRHVSK